MDWTLYLWLLLQIVCSTALFIALKLSKVKNVNQYHFLAVNYLVAFLAPLSALDYQVGFQLENGKSIFSLWIAVLIGFLFVASFILMLKSTEKVGVGLTSAFSKISVLIPVLFGMIFLGQSDHLLVKIAGIILTLIAFYLILYKKNSTKQPITASVIILSLSVFFLSGLQDVLQELGNKLCVTTGNDRQIFLIVLFGTSLLLTLILSVVDGIKKGFKFSWMAIWLGLFLGICNYFFSELLLRNVANLGGTIVFPIVNASTVLFTTLVGIFFFKEKLSKKQWWGLFIAIVAVALIATAI